MVHARHPLQRAVPAANERGPRRVQHRGDHTYSITFRTCAAACKCASTHPGRSKHYLAVNSGANVFYAGGPGVGAENACSVKQRFFVVVFDDQDQLIRYDATAA